MPNLTPSLEPLIKKIHQEAQREAFPIDELIYQEAGLDPTYPILYGGNLASSVCFFARDLGKDEVQAQQPLYGSAGKLVRRGVFTAKTQQLLTTPEDFQQVLNWVVLTNTVPYKPPGNKAYSEAVKKRFRPFLEQFLVFHWQGDKIITLGNEAFNWFIPYGKKGELKEFFKNSDRYTSQITIQLSAQDDQGTLQQRPVTLYPLPHPSPLNQTYYAQFPSLLAQRLAAIEFP